jgi:hypothetical protein
MNNKNVEIIEVDLGIDLAEEIKNCVDSLSSDLLEHTKKVIQKNSMKLQKTNKRKLAVDARDARVQRVIEFLEAEHKAPDRWVTSSELLEVANIEITPQNLNKLSMQIRKRLRLEDKWTVDKKRRSKTMVYRLVRFS